MKKSLITVIIAAIAGFIIAYFVTNLFYPSIESVQIKTINNEVTSSIDMPSDDVFNFRSINPTVEVYVGQCKEYNENGDCIDSVTATDDSDESSTGEESTSPEESGIEESGSGNSD